MDEGIEGRMDEGRDGDKDEEKKKSTVGKSKMNPKIDPRGSKNRPKTVKNEGKRDKKAKYRLQDDPGRPRRPRPPLWWQIWGPTWGSKNYFYVEI